MTDHDFGSVAYYAMLRSKKLEDPSFDPSELASPFKRYYGTQQRIRVSLKSGGELTGTVGMTTGWRPAFLLMRRSNAQGSSIVLGKDDVVTHEQRGKNYVEVDW